MDLIIGTVARSREWIIAHWAQHARAAAVAAELEPTFMLVADQRDSTVAELLRVEPAARIVHVDELEFVDRRDWTTAGRKERMVELRNQLLTEVRDLGPSWFWSLDSDILAHPDALSAMVAHVRRGFDAVGGACFMRPPSRRRDGGVLASTRDPSFMRRPSPHAMPVAGNFTPKATIAVDVIMANKLMTPPAYAIDYVHHHRGEDIGWSCAARAAKLRLGWTAAVVSKHVMAPEWRDVIDPRCGF